MASGYSYYPTMMNTKLKFKTEVDIKPPTELNTDELKASILKEEEIIRSLRSKDSILAYTHKLMKEIEDLEEMKAKGYDKMALKEQYQDVQYKFELLEEMKGKIVDDQNQSVHLRKNVVDATTLPIRNYHFYRSNTKQDGELIETPREIRRAHSASSLVPNATPKVQSKSPRDIERIKPDQSNLSFFEYFNGLHDSCEVAIIFHCCVGLLPFHTYFNLIKEKFFINKPKLRLALIYCNDVDKYEISNFATKTEFSLDKFKKIESTDIRNNVIDLNWSKSSVKIVCNIVTSLCKHKKIDKIIQKDEVHKLMNYNNLMDYLFYIDFYGQLKMDHKKCIFKNLLDIFNETKFASMISIKTKYNMMTHLYNLKRMNFMSNSKLLKDSIFPRSVPYISFKDHNHVKCLLFENINSDYFDTRSLNLSDYSKKIEAKFDILNRNQDVTQFFKLHEASLTLSSNSCQEKLWIEVFSNDEIYSRVMEIHLIARYLSQKFNDLYNKMYIKVSRPYLLKAPDKLFFGQRLYSQEQELSFKMNNKILQAFMHFTYEYSKRSLILIDLRPFEIERDTYLLTEPIIFSTNEHKFGPSNLGTKAIIAMMSKHTCNEICQRLTSKTLNFELTDALNCSLM